MIESRSKTCSIWLVFCSARATRAPNIIRTLIFWRFLPLSEDYKSRHQYSVASTRESKPQWLISKVFKLYFKADCTNRLIPQSEKALLFSGDHFQLCRMIESDYQCRLDRLGIAVETRCHLVLKIWQFSQKWLLPVKLIMYFLSMTSL